MAHAGTDRERDEDDAPILRESRRTGLVRLLMTFTLTLMVLGLVAIPSFDGVPNPRGQRLQVLDSMEAIWRAQSEFRTKGLLDRDGDGVGEFGSLAELAGQTVLRSGDAAIEVPLLGPSYVPKAGGRLRRHGYVFELWLPGPRGSWISASAAPRELQHVDSEAAERSFCLFVWPATSYGARSDGAALFLDAAGELYASPCSEIPWAASSITPHPAMLVGTGVAFGSEKRPAPVLHDFAGRPWRWHAR